jgi:hypothetical protein
VSPYRNPRVLIALLGIAGAGIALIVLINRTADGRTRTVATIAVAVALWIGLMALLRGARSGQ